MNDTKIKAYACYNQDEAIRNKSTSGGIFYLVAKYVIENLNGYVCAAVFDKNFKVVHRITNRLQEVEQMLGSKYPQSALGNTFKEIKALLDRDEYVLFCGTPCQVNGLKSYLQKDYPNLLTLDFVCHGVASPEIWDDYLTIFCDKSKLKSVRFKDKVKGWKRWHVKYQYEGKTHYCYGVNDVFMRSYLSKINHRPSCYSCKCKGMERRSDFTVADCWGEGEKNSRLNDDKGLSAFLIRTEVGIKVFDAVSSMLIYQEYDVNILMKGNWAYINNSEKPANRDAFFEVYSQADLKQKKKIMKKNFGMTFKKWLSYLKMRIQGKVI